MRNAPRPFGYPAGIPLPQADERIPHQSAASTLRMLGSSIATPSASVWIADFLNAAYFARDEAERDIGDLRLAQQILATHWSTRNGRRLSARDLPAFHHAFGAARAHEHWRLRRPALLKGAAVLLGEWFPAAATDPKRWAHGVVFETAGERDGFDPVVRLRQGALRALTPPALPENEREWATYDPVELPRPDRALAMLRDPARWPEFGSELGAFTATGRGGLRGQTFEIQLVLTPAKRVPVLTRGYVTCTELLFAGERLDRRVAQLSAHIAAMPEGARAQTLAVLTTHDGHFLGRALSHLLVFEHGGSYFIRDVGCWDPLPLHLRAAYDHGGHEAQVAFWGPALPAQSMLAQLAAVSAV